MKKENKTDKKQKLEKIDPKIFKHAKITILGIKSSGKSKLINTFIDYYKKSTDNFTFKHPKDKEKYFIIKESMMSDEYFYIDFTEVDDLDRQFDKIKFCDCLIICSRLDNKEYLNNLIQKILNPLESFKSNKSIYILGNLIKENEPYKDVEEVEKDYLELFEDFSTLNLKKFDYLDFDETEKVSQKMKEILLSIKSKLNFCPDDCASCCIF